jgi:hypothetical protein
MKHSEKDKDRRRNNCYQERSLTAETERQTDRWTWLGGVEKLKSKPRTKSGRQ